jgi:hypothetical protein
VDVHGARIAYCHDGERCNVTQQVNWSGELIPIAEGVIHAPPPNGGAMLFAAPYGRLPGSRFIDRFARWLATTPPTPPGALTLSDGPSLTPSYGTTP